MCSLQAIQKTFRVFQPLSKAAKILCIAGAALCGAGALCAVTKHNGRQMFCLFGDPLKLFANRTELTQKLPAPAESTELI